MFEADIYPICCLNDKEKYVIHITNLKEAFNHGLQHEKFYKVIKINQRQWSKTGINLNSAKPANDKTSN